MRLGRPRGPVWTGGKSRPHRDSIPNRPVRSSVAIPTELPCQLQLQLHLTNGHMSGVLTKHSSQQLSLNPCCYVILPCNSLSFTYSLTPWCRVLLEKLTGLQLVKKFPAFHGTRRFITALTSVRQLSLSRASPIQSIYPHPTSWRSILILSTHLRLGLPSGLLPSGFPTKTLYTPLSSPIRAMCPAHLILLDLITRTILGEEYKSFSSSLCNLLHSLVTSSLLGPNNLLL